MSHVEREAEGGACWLPEAGWFLNLVLPGLAVTAAFQRAAEEVDLWEQQLPYHQLPTEVAVFLTEHSRKVLGACL